MHAEAAAVIGSRFGPELVTALGTDPLLDELVKGELIDQVGFTPRVEYAFRHPLIRAVAYESRLKSDRAELHRLGGRGNRIREPEAVDENAALVAEHLKAAGDCHAAYGWHMRAAGWLTTATSPRQGPAGSMRATSRIDCPIPTLAAPRCGRACGRCCAPAPGWPAGPWPTPDSTNCANSRASAGDKVSLAMGTAGYLPALVVHARFRGSIGSWLRTRLTCSSRSATRSSPCGCSTPRYPPRCNAASSTEAVRLAQRVIDLADGNVTMGNFIIGYSFGCRNHAARRRTSCPSETGGWTTDVEQATTMVRVFNPTLRALMLFFKVILIPNGICVPESADLRDTAEVLELAERSGDNLTLACARCNRGIVPRGL